MFKTWRAGRQAQKRRRDIGRKVDDLARRFPEIDWTPFRAISEFFADKSLSSVEEQAFLYRLATSLPADAQIVEIGSWIGHGTCSLASALRGPRARCFAVDAFSCWSDTPGENATYRRLLDRIDPHRSQREIFDAHLARFGLTERVVPVVGDTRQVVASFPLAPGAADLLFIDGGHDLETVRADIRNYLPFLKQGGIAAFHDFNSSCGVPIAVWEEIQRGTFDDLLGIFGTLIAFRHAA